MPIGLSIKTPMYNNTVGYLLPFFLGPCIAHHASDSQVQWLNHSNQAYSHILLNRLQSRGKASASA
jgi:hypothetical protein